MKTYQSCNVTAMGLVIPMPDASFTLVMRFRHTSQTEWKQLRGIGIEETFQVETKTRENGDKGDGTKTSNINTCALPKNS